MGKKARLKKQAKIEVLIQERQMISERKNAARAPIVRAVKRVAVAVIMTILLLIIGQVVNQRIAQASAAIEVNQK